MMKEIMVSLALVCCGSASQGAEEKGTGSIEGRITYTGEMPKSRPDDAGIRRDLLEVDRATRGLRGAVVYITPASGISLRATPGGQPATNPVIDQVDYAFMPRVVAVREGGVVVFRNSDPANHNVRASGWNRTNEFNVFTGVDGTYEHRFVVQTNYRPVRLGCDIHPWMSAWVYVFDHSHFAVTDAQGRFEISGVPAGEHEFHVVQPDIGYHKQRRIAVRPGEKVDASTLIHRDGR